jgi:hypothetical protein
MAQYNIETTSLDPKISSRYEVMYLANGALGNLVSTINPLPVTLGSNNITITGDVNVGTTVNVTSSPSNPVHVHLTEVGTYGNLTTFIPIQGNVTANGTVNVGNLPQIQTVNGSVFIANTTLSITGNVTANGTINVGNFPSSFNIGNLPATQTVNGSVFLSNSSISVTGNVTANGTINVGNFPSTQTVNGTINIGNTVQVNVINFPATQNVNLVGASANTPPLVSFADTVQMDTTDRLRVSVQGQQWWYVPTVDKDGDLRIVEKIQGANGANSVFIQNLASVRLSSGTFYSSNTQLTGTAIRASRRRHKSRPGVSQEWLGIVNWDGLQTNVTKRIGLFTNYNGIFFEATDTVINAVVRKRLTDGTLVETRVPHTSWTKDTMNGSGPSGYNWNSSQNIVANVTSVVSTSNVAISGDGNVYQVVYQMPAGQESLIPVGKKVTLTGLSPTGFNDTGLITSIDTGNHRVTVSYIAYPGTYSSETNAKMTNTPFHQQHTYWFDASGSRTARIRFGIYTDAGKVCVHEYLGGEMGSQVISAPALMDRKEIVNVGQPVGFLPSMTVGGSAITIETASEINPGFGVAQSNTHITFDKNSPGPEYALLGIGIRAGEPYQRADIQVQSIQLVDIGNINPQNAGIIQWRLVLNPTLSAVPSPKDVGKATHMWDYAQGTTITGGIDLLGGYSQGTLTQDVKTALNFLNMGSNIDYTDSDIVVLAAKLLVGGSSNSLILGTISYLEDL